MPAFCSVVNCGMRAERDQVSFFRIPAAFKNRGDRLNALSRERRTLWIKSLKRGDLSEIFLRNARICSRHFIGETPAPLEDKDSPDWVPNQNMGYTTIKTKNESSVQRHYRSLNRTKCMKLVGENDPEDDRNNTPSLSTHSEIVPQDIAATINSETTTIKITVLSKNFIKAQKKTK